MLKTSIQFVNEKPMINIDGCNYPPLAYTTYFDECGKWSDFADNGYKMFFINVSFTNLPINNNTGFSPFLTGVFEEDIPDYTSFDNLVSSVLRVCPDAFIFPRINIAMPAKWLKTHPYETVITQIGTHRESLYSDLFKKDGADYLRQLVDHIRNSSYSDRIAGYQLCGGTTQEWIHHDLFGSFSEMGLKKFNEWNSQKCGIYDTVKLEKSGFTGEYLSEDYRKYCEFCGEKTAETVEYFAEVLKKYIDGQQIVGVFYGYNAFVNDPLWGLHGLRFIIDSPYIDFFSSPCGYDNNRKLGIDWCDMIPADSLKLHGKLYFVECDVRTHMTRKMQDSRPGVYPEDIYNLFDKDGNKTVWCGPDSSDLSLSALRKAFAHQLTKASGIWWFDMWGGWFSDEKIMAELKEHLLISEESELKDRGVYPSAQVVLFIDEKAYFNTGSINPLRHSVNHIRYAMGNTGIPFDVYMVEDAQYVIHRYSAAVFTAPIPSNSGIKAMGICKNKNIPFLAPNVEKTNYSTDELRDLLVSYGVHCYNNAGNVIYCSGGYLCVHTIKDGKVDIYLPEKHKLKLLLGAEKKEYFTDIINISVPCYSTLIFEISE